MAVQTMNSKGKCGDRTDEEAVVMIGVGGEGSTKVKAVETEENESSQET